MPNGTVCVSCSAEMVRLADGRLPAGSEEAIKFCMTHFIQSQLKWFPFIRPQSLRAGWLRSGRALLLAALGARGIKEYKALAGDLWAEAVRRVEAWAFSSPAASGADALSNFQTKILVLDYLQWSEDNRHPEWVGPMLDEMAYREARELASMLVDRPAGGPAHTSLEHEEASQEEIRWTLWKFYCTATRAMLLGFTILPPRLFQTLDLPGDPNRLLALWKNSSGRESDRSVSSMRSESCGRGLTLPGVLDALLSDDGRRAALPGMLSLTGKYIVLHAILYLSETMVEESADAESAAREPPGWQTETRERVYLLVVRWRQCFWIPPEITWKTAFPEFGSLQSIMFVHYLAVRIGQQPVRDSTGARPVRCARTPYARYAIRCIVTIHVSMKNNDLVDVAATGRWWLDGATWRTGGLAAKYAMDWFRDRARFGFEDEDIEYLQSLESAMASYSDAGSYDGASYSPARLAQLERSVRHLWTMVLGTESWLDSRFAEPSEPSHR
ncbi:hypothetical protein F4802DRAFT_542574 [Xylaria palmicola]|nr:hypothetical protein F4802DRAFT_542574 [Xylaria palmicola]